MAITTITKENFQEEIIDSRQPILVDFWATWCGPCKMMSPVVDALGEELPHVKVAKVNVDEETELAQAFNISSIPTLVVIKNGEIVDTSVGVRSKDQIKAMLED